MGILLIFSSCSQQEKQLNMKSPPKSLQWLNPLFYNNDFEHDLNFPLWFDDSLIVTHQIYKITKRVFPRIVGDTAEINSYKEAIPREKIEYYFDPNGLVDQMVIYTYYDDREVSRATFVYEGNMMANGYRKVKMLPFISLSKTSVEDEFTTDLYEDLTHQYSVLSFVGQKKKYKIYVNTEKKNFLFEIKKRKYWGPLSIDSIVHPNKEDWIVLGTMRKPYKKYHVENIVNESSVFKYKYWQTGVLKKRRKIDYPFEYDRTFLYDKKGIWVGYVDSTFSEGNFITKIQTQILFDEYDRPVEMNHRKLNDENEGFFYKETLHYRTNKTKK